MAHERITIDSYHYRLALQLQAQWWGGWFRGTEHTIGCNSNLPLLPHTVVEHYPITCGQVLPLLPETY